MRLKRSIMTVQSIPGGINGQRALLLEEVLLLAKEPMLPRESPE